MNERRRRILRASLAAVPLTLLVFAFGMVQVVGIEKAHASFRQFLYSLDFSDFSLLGKQSARSGSFVVNGRLFETRIGEVNGSGPDVLESYNRVMDQNNKRVIPTQDGGQILKSDGRSLSMVSVQENARSRKTTAMETVSHDIVTERQRAIADDPVITALFASLEQRDLTNAQLMEGAREYMATQSISDERVALFLHELYVRIDEIKSTIDVPGEDLADLERYPGSTRVLDIAKRNGTVKMLSFRTETSMSSALSFYRAEIEHEQWQSIEGFEQASDLSDDLKFYLLRKPDKMCLLSLKYTESDDLLINMLLVHGFTSSDMNAFGD